MASAQCGNQKTNNNLLPIYSFSFQVYYFSQRRLNLKIVLLLPLAKKKCNQITLSAEHPFATLFHSLFSKKVLIKVLLELFMFEMYMQQRQNFCFDF